MSQAKMGAKVMYCGHDGWFIADVYRIGNVNVIKANGAIDGDNLVRGRNDEATHHVSDFPTSGYWNPRIGVFVVLEAQVEALKSKEVAATPKRTKVSK